MLPVKRRVRLAGFSHVIAPHMRKTKRLALIVHGARADLPGVRHVVSWVRAKGHVVRPRVTWEKGDAAEFARDAVAAGVDAVIACGGDGTVNEVVNGLDGSKIPLGIIPVGTANDFAKQVGIPTDPDPAMDIVLRRRPVHIDTASMNGRRFLNVSTAGVGAEATAETPEEAKEALGPFAYLITGLRKLMDLTPRHARFIGPGLDLETSFLIFAVGNARMTGGGTLITPLASVRDGLLDLCIVGEMARADFAKLLPRFRRGDHLENESVHYVQLPWLRVEADTPLTVNVDGESSETTRIEYAARPRDLVIHLPRLPGERRSVERMGVR